LTGAGLVRGVSDFLLSGEVVGPSGRVVGWVVGLSDGGVCLALFAVGLSGDVAGLSDRAFGSAVGLSGCVVGLADRAVGPSCGVVDLSGRVVGLSGDVAGLSGRAFGSVVGLSGCVVGLAGRAVALSGCSFVFSFFSCPAAGELVSPARKANASPAASQRDFDFK